MNQKMSELRVQRARLQERIAAQRATLRHDIAPVQQMLQRVDRRLAWVRLIARPLLDTLKQHPGLATLTFAGAFFFKADGLWRWTKRGFLAWRTWKILRGHRSASNGLHPLL